MEYLNIKRSQTQLRADGSRYAVLSFITKSAKFGQILNERNISVKKPILITGEPDSGKTRWITRLHQHALEIWGTKSKAAPLLLDARSPLASWSNTPAVKQWWKEKQKTLPTNERQTWAAMKQDERSNILPTYCAETGAVLFIDDAHKLDGPKLKLALQCTKSARIWVVAAYKKQRISSKLLKALVECEPQRFQLQIFPKHAEEEI